MSANQKLEMAAKSMAAAADDGRSVAAILKKQCPRVYAQIHRDAHCPPLLSYWGRCINVDENVGKTIVHPSILEAIGDLAGVPMRGRGVHAGLQHTYGYLFSLIETPYGFKRDRWTTNDLERGFGVEQSLFGDNPRHGTLLANVTWFLGQIVFRQRPRTLLAFSQIAPAIARELVDYDFSRLSPIRIEEHVVVAGKINREIAIHTDLVPFPHRPDDPDAANTLLVYSVQAGLTSPIKLITAFPVTQATVSQTRESVRNTRSVEIRLRYNAYVRGLYGRKLEGVRFVAPTL